MEEKTKHNQYKSMKETTSSNETVIEYSLLVREEYYWVSQMMMEMPSAMRGGML